MYITRDILAPVEQRFGQPRVLTLEQEIGPAEMTMVRSSQKRGRAHDVTFFILNPQGLLAVIAKPFFAPGAYRAPSGGIDPGEDFVTGTLREAWEETGLQIQLQRYILRVEATFTSGADVLRWTSHVVTAATTETALEPHDHNEIKEAKFMTLEELQGPVRHILWHSGQGLFRYRCLLTDAAVELIRSVQGRAAGGPAPTAPPPEQAVGVVDPGHFEDVPRPHPEQELRRPVETRQILETQDQPAPAVCQDPAIPHQNGRHLDPGHHKGGREREG